MSWEMWAEILTVPAFALALFIGWHFIWRGLPDKVRPDHWEDLVRVFAFPIPVAVRAEMRCSKDPLAVLEDYVHKEMSRLRMEGQTPKAARIYHAWMRTRAFSEGVR